MEITIDELGNLTGTSVRLNTSISQRKYRANIIGYNKGKSLIITQPVAESGGVDLMVGEEVVVRFLANEKACAFKSGVVHIASAPYKHIHLTYPAQLQFENYRNYIRLTTRNLIAWLLIPGQEPLKVIVTDLSLGGIQLLCRSPELTEGMELNIELVLPEQSNIEPIVLPIAIRNFNPSEGTFDRYGLEFVRLEQDNIPKLQQLMGYCISSPVKV